MTARERGDHTKNTGVLLHPADEAALGAAISERLPWAAWQCDQPGPSGLHEVHHHPDVRSAMTCGGVQAYVPLPAGAGTAGVHDLAPHPPADVRPRSSAIVQLLRSEELSGAMAGQFRLGRLCVTWNAEEAGPEAHQTLLEQSAVIWSALTSTTKPAHLVHVRTGKSVRGRRVGPAAREYILASGLPVTETSHRELRLDP